MNNVQRIAVSPSAFGLPRDFLGNRFVYVVVSSRARGLSIGINVNPDKQCNFNCEYCEVDRGVPSAEKLLDTDAMAVELQRTVALADSGGLKQIPAYQQTNAELLILRHIALSGDGEPTRAANFLEVAQEVVRIRAIRYPFLKIVLITNASGLDLPEVKQGLKLLTAHDEIWAKLDAGTQDYMNRVNHPDCSMEKILENILLTARKRPVIIQSLFPMIDHQGPSPEEIEQYANRLRKLKDDGAQIPLVQVYSATRPAFQPRCGHLPLKTLSQIARRVREVSGLSVEVY